MRKLGSLRDLYQVKLGAGHLPEFREESVRIVATLAERSPACKFNYCVTELPALFEMKTWIDANAMTETIRCGDHPLVEIFFRSSPRETDEVVV